MPPNLWSLYGLMLKSRLFEEAIAKLWHDGLISGEMHLGTGEEAIIAGVVDHLREGDAMALDHRGTSALLMRGVDAVLILRELLGFPGGLCGGMGGHMHLLSKEHLSVASGIVGAEGPAAVGFALAAQHRDPGAVAVAFFGEGAMNQGMLMESMNLAATWNLPVLFVCKDDRWAITTRSDTVTAGGLKERAEALGVPAIGVDGCNVSEVWNATHDAITRVRSGEGPAFLHAGCVHLEGHFLGFQLIRVVRDPLREMRGMAIPLTKSLLHTGGAPARERITGLKAVIAAVLSTLRDPRQDPTSDPVRRTRTALHSDLARLQTLEDDTERWVDGMIASAIVEAPS